MSRKSCRESLDMYKAFLDRTEKVTKFVTLAENAGVGDKGSLGLQTVPPKVLETLENHLANLEKNKTSQSDSDEVKSPSLAANQIPLKINKPESTPVAKKPNAPTQVSQNKPEMSAKPQQMKKPDELLDNLLDDKSSNDKPSEVAVRTQLRRPEQQHSVAVTVKRPGRSPSPARPPRPISNRSRDPSPVNPPVTSKEHHDEEDFFSHLREDTSANLDVSPTTPVNGRASPFAGDEKPLESSESFWDSNVQNSDTNKNVGDIDFESAFSKDAQVSKNETNLFETDLLGLDISCDPVSMPLQQVEVKNSVFSDLDDLFAIGPSDSTNLTDTPLAPCAITPVAAKSMNDDLLGSLSSINPSYSNNVTTHQMNTSNTMSTTNTSSVASNKPTKPTDVGLNDTLAVLAQSLGKTENKWSSPKPQTLAGKTRDTVGISTGPTVNWSGNNNTSGNGNGNSTNTNSSTNNNDNFFADLLG